MHVDALCPPIEYDALSCAKPRGGGGMARSFMQYWKPAEAKKATGTLEHTAGDQLRRVQRGDVVWIVTVFDGKLWTLGRIVAGFIGGQRATERWLRSTNLWPAKTHVVAAPRSARRPRLTDLTELAPGLRFKGTVDRLPRRFSGTNLQTMRELSRESAKMVSRAWFGTRPPPVQPVDTDEPLSQEGLRVLREHVRVERSASNRNLVLAGREKPYECDACGESFASLFGSEFGDYIQVHHKVPVSRRERTPKKADFALLCANCHSIAHWRRALRPRSVADLKKLRVRA